ncbi:F-box domain containing protein [Musa troglodytarum]|uniref:F-box domain containing protein n=1 Tax=Musa troglodytarum TaxID=320322 RepID=A0A9E7F9L2_9LILI|nr:F-box domain containing protein [Musa troglodytarum]
MHCLVRSGFEPIIPEEATNALPIARLRPSPSPSPSCSEAWRLGWRWRLLPPSPAPPPLRRSSLTAGLRRSVLLGVTVQAEKDEIVKAVMELKNSTIEDGYTAETIVSRKDLLMDVRDKLLFEPEYAGNIKEKVPPKSSLRIPWSWLPVALCLLQEFVLTFDWLGPSILWWIQAVWWKEGHKGSDHHGPPKINMWEDPLSPSKWKEEHFVLTSLTGWALLFYGGYKLFGGKKDTKEVVLILDRVSSPIGGRKVGALDLLG